MAKQSIRKFKKLLKGQSRAQMTAGDWAEVRDILGKDAGPGVRKKARSNPKQPHKRVRRALKKYVKSELGLPTQYTPAKVRVNPKGGLDIKFARPPRGKTRNPRGFSVKANRNPDQEFLIEFNSGGGWRNAGTVYASSAKEAKRVFKQQASSHAYDGMKLRVRRA